MSYCSECGHDFDEDDDRVETITTTEGFKRIGNAIESIAVLIKRGNQLLQQIKDSNVNASSLVIEYGKQFRSEMQREVGALAEQARLAAMESVTAEFIPVTTPKKKPKKRTPRAKK